MFAVLGTLFLYSCLSNGNDPRRTDKFGNLNGKGLNYQYVDSQGNTIDAHPGYTTNIINLINQFLNPDTLSQSKVQV